MFCKNCGKEIPDNSEFCKYCGSSKDGTIIAKSQVVSSTKKFNLLKIIVPVIAVFAVLFILFCRGKSHKNEWVEKNGVNVYYDDNGKIVMNQTRIIDGINYKFDNQGYATMTVNPEVKKTIDGLVNSCKKLHDELMDAQAQILSSGRLLDPAGPGAYQIASKLNEFHNKKKEFDKISTSNFSEADKEYYNSKKSSMDSWAYDLR